MATVIEAVYENGVLRPLSPAELKEQQRYRLILEEVGSEEQGLNPALAAEIERRTMTLPDGGRVIRLGGILADYLPAIGEDEDPFAAALEELRRERAKHFEDELNELFPGSNP